MFYAISGQYWERIHGVPERQNFVDWLLSIQKLSVIQVDLYEMSAKTWNLKL